MLRKDKIMACRCEKNAHGVNIGDILKEKSVGRTPKGPADADM